MKLHYENQRPCIAIAILAVACWGVCFLAIPSVWGEDSVRTLFDGKSLDGWEADTKYWRVEEGTMVGEIAPGQTLNKNTWIVWRGGELGDFELNLQFRLTGLPAANSGIQIRCQVDHVDHVSGYQADLDMGETWLGRIYDEHGRALLVERGQRVHLLPDGTRKTHAFAPLEHYPVLYREREWNDYRIVAVGERIDVYVNGTLFSSLWDQQTQERDLTGSLAFQLHSGPETRIAFRDIRLEVLSGRDANRLAPMEFLEQSAPTEGDSQGIAPVGPQGESLNLGFEAGNLEGWSATGTAFRGQPVERDGISRRWPGQSSNKSGRYFIGGFELEQDKALGTLESVWFPATHPFAGFLLGGGADPSTRVEIRRRLAPDAAPEVIAQGVGNNQESMRRVTIDLQSYLGQEIQVRLVDENEGGWGHLNFDDFRFYDAPPTPILDAPSHRSTFNAILHHLTPNALRASQQDSPAASTLSQMFVPNGFSVELIAAEPDVHQPIASAFDEQGRLWVVEGHSYPQKRPAGEGLDRILIFADNDGDGRFEERKVFIEGLNLASGIEVGYGGVWVGAAPELLFIPDKDRDDIPDSAPQALLDGFGFADTHETLNSFLWGPDGWLYGTQGVFNSSRIGPPGTPEKQRVHLAAGVWRYHPTRHVFEVFAHGGSNPWGLDYDEHGQLFMTHCRSFWGRGGTTHVMQGGHYWNQVNSGHAPFVSPVALPNHPHLQNFLLASARYDSGEGGAGKPGTRDVYGGHSHVGTLIYLGDNFPDTYRNHLLTHNLHGHQINHQINRREAGGYHTVHAGQDVLFCSDPQFIGVDLMLGPDGAVYMTDWYDPRLCHSPNVEQWDRGNGRIYRMQFDATYQPAKVDWHQASDAALLDAQKHRNDWHARAARRVLASRYANQDLPEAVMARLTAMATRDPEEQFRLRALWTLQSAGAFSDALARQLMNDASEYVRAWAIQGALDIPPSESTQWLVEHCRHESSLLVRRYLASAMSRMPSKEAWQIGEILASDPTNASDRDLPVMIWQGVAALATNDPRRVSDLLELAKRTPLVTLRDSIAWYAARTTPEGRNALVAQLQTQDAQGQIGALELLEYALRGMRGLEAPTAWKSIADRLYGSGDDRIRRAAEIVGAQFGDPTLFERMRQHLQQDSASDWKHAFNLLSLDRSDKNIPVLLKQLDHAERIVRVLPMLRAYDGPEIAEAVLARLPEWEGDADAAAMDMLSSRTVWANPLLDAIADQRLDRARLTAFHARQIALLEDERLTKKLTEQWGQVRSGSEALREEIKRLASIYKEAPLWAFDAGMGKQHFQKLCASCHSLDPSSTEIAPKLQGTSAKGIDYAIENVLDPNAVIGRDYQARVVRTVDGQIITDLVVMEGETSLQIRTATDTLTVNRDEIEEYRVSENSFMPMGLLETLNDSQRIELIKYLMSL